MCGVNIPRGRLRSFPAVVVHACAGDVAASLVIPPYTARMRRTVPEFGLFMQRDTTICPPIMIVYPWDGSENSRYLRALRGVGLALRGIDRKVAVT